jgi:hypothetical protein
MHAQNPVVGIHLDLKYVMPDKAWLTRWVRELPGLGINTLLLEYEDKFPFRKYPFLRAPGAFSETELRSFLDAARGAGLRVVPMMQSISHLEFALHHESLAHLREAPHVLTQIDTSSAEARQFVLDLMDEVLEFHGPDEWIHIGGDEAWHLGHNPRTEPLVQQHGKVGYWARIIGETARFVLGRGKRPLIFDDALWNHPEALQSLDLPREVILHSWNYGSTDDEAKVAKLVERIECYHAAGHQSIAAPCLNWGVMVPRHTHCLSNTRSWAMTAHRTGMLGMINTAWAVFHVLPHAQSLQIAATGRLMRDISPLPADWAGEQLSQLFGVSSAIGSDAALGMERCTGFWEHPVPNLMRPITPILYGYMDMLMSCRDQQQRMAVGSYPPDMWRIDFDGLTHRKLAILRGEADRDAVRAKLRSLLEEFTEARRLLEPLATHATLRREEAAYFALAAKLKQAHARLLLDQVGGPVDVEARQQWQHLGAELKTVLTPLIDPHWLDWLPMAWWRSVQRSIEPS